MLCGAHVPAGVQFPGQSLAVKEQIVEMALNASGIRDTARVLPVSTNTVMRELKKAGRNVELRAQQSAPALAVAR
jgi:transposase-like protein